MPWQDRNQVAALAGAHADDSDRARWCLKQKLAESRLYDPQALRKGAGSVVVLIMPRLVVSEHLSAILTNWLSSQVETSGLASGTSGRRGERSCHVGQCRHVRAVDAAYPRPARSAGMATFVQMKADIDSRV